jgi:peptidylprolyl isomerase/FKBP-type peptidyl-prolyl cis-trans isomerase FkpA
MEQIKVSVVQIIIIIAVVGLVVYAVATHRSAPQSATTTMELQTTVIQEGTGEATKSGDKVTVNYTGTFEDGKKFDSNVDPAFNHVQPFSFTLGAGQVIQGWDQGVLGMKVGEKRKIFIPYTLGYGENGYGPIPPKANLIFEVEVTKIN